MTQIRVTSDPITPSGGPVAVDFVAQRHRTLERDSFAVARRGAPSLLPKGAAKNRRFTRNELIELVRLWTRRYGEPPRVIDLEPARARRLGQAWRAERFEEENWPSARMIVREFGSMTAALDAAGIAARPRPVRTAANLRDASAITRALRRWVRLYGEVPTLADWDPSRARRLNQDWRIARYYRHDWPSARTVIARFGSMSAAIAAAKLPPRPVGAHGSGRASERAAVRLALVSSESRRPGGAPELGLALRRVAAARRGDDPTVLHSSLIDLASAALDWAGTLTR